MITKTCCITGHRNINVSAELLGRLENEIRTLINEGVRIFGAGGALGFDMLASQAVVKIKRERADVKLVLVLPCKNHERFWAEKDKKPLMK